MSGLAAIYSAITYYQPQRIFIDGGYHGTHQVIDLLKHRWDTAIQVVPTLSDCPTTLAASHGGLRKGDMLWLETPRNPDLRLFDIAAYSEVARAHDSVVVVDGTFSPPPLQHPLRLGAHCVMHSTTKYLAGHSDAVGGALVTQDEQTAADLQMERAVMGNTPGSLESWLLLRSLRTLRLRVEAQSKGASQLAAELLKHPNVQNVHHPSLPHHEQYDLAQNQMASGGCGVLSVELESAEVAQAVLGHLRLFRNATSLGGVESLIEWRHQYDQDVSPCLLRISVGLEHPDDLLSDFRNALQASHNL